MKPLVVKTHKKDGHLFYTPQQSAMAQNWLKKLPEEQKVTVTYDPSKPKRSQEQNRYYWFYLNIISEDIGYTKEELHDYFKSKYLTKEIKEILGVKTRIRRSTTDLDKFEFMELINSIEAETGIPAPDTSYYELAPLKWNSQNNKKRYTNISKNTERRQLSSYVTT